MIPLVSSFRCWDDDEENGMVLWIIQGPILLTVLVSLTSGGLNALKTESQACLVPVRQGCRATCGICCFEVSEAGNCCSVLAVLQMEDR